MASQKIKATVAAFERTIQENSEHGCESTLFQVPSPNSRRALHTQSAPTVRRVLPRSTVHAMMTSNASSQIRSLDLQGVSHDNDMPVLAPLSVSESGMETQTTKEAQSSRPCDEQEDESDIADPFVSLEAINTVEKISSSDDGDASIQGSSVASDRFFFVEWEDQSKATFQRYAASRKKPIELPEGSTSSRRIPRNVETRRGDFDGNNSSRHRYRDDTYGDLTETEFATEEVDIREVPRIQTTAR